MYENLTAIILNEGYRLGLSVVALIVIYFIYKASLRFLKKQAQKLDFEPHIVNALRLVIRVFTLAASIIAIFTFFDIPSDLFVGTSALLGAALGFGSSQTINNIVAGFYVLVSQPFKVKDYVKIGDLEGQVEEININYTSLYTPTFNLLKVPNTQVMNSRILNLTHEGVIKYTFMVGFSHDFTEADVMSKIIEPAITEFCQTYCNLDVRQPEAYLEKVDRFEKTYLFRLFVPKGEAKILYTIEPELMQLLMKYFDKLRKGN